MSFSELDRAIVDFEREWRMLDGAKADAIRDTLGLSASTYYRRLGELIDSPGALEYDPLVIHRLRHTRRRRRAERFVGSTVGGRSGR
jgi:hypothetical protein